MDVIRNLDLIRELIPAKLSVTENEVLRNLKAKYGIKLAYLDGQEIGLTVWYESYHNPYIWLGAYKISGRGIGSRVLEVIIGNLKRLNYEAVTVKTGRETIAANRQLEKYGFLRIEDNGDTYLWKKQLTSSGDING